MATHFKGPVISDNGFTGSVAGAVAATTLTASTSLAVGAAGIAIKQIKSAAISVTVSALADAAEEDISLTITGVAAGDLVLLAPINAAMETGLAVIGAWVSAANTVKLRVSNVKGSGLTGSTANWNYVWYDLT